MQTLHLFNTHTQATYIGEEKVVRLSVLTRLMQLREVVKAMESALNTYGYRKGELVMLIGDLNVNSTSPMWNRLFVAKHPQLAHPDLFEKEHYNEYKAMLHLLSGDQLFQVHDLLAQSHGGVRPATYGHSSKEGG